VGVVGIWQGSDRGLNQFEELADVSSLDRKAELIVLDLLLVPAEV
jgi:hypothetical protein